MCAAKPSLQQLLESPNLDPLRAKMAWRLFRQFQEPADFAREFDSEIERSFQWRIDQQSGDVHQRAIKLGLSCKLPAHGHLRCETVVLFPGKSIPPETSNVALAKHEPFAERAVSMRKISSRQPSMRKNACRLRRATACVSSQPGCGVGCPFCATGELGYRGHLSVQQIVEQVFLAGLIANRAHHRLRNVVFMGMGEPMHNLPAVLQSLEILTHQQRFGLQPRHITVSTAGVPSAMVQLAKAHPRVRIALSLHSAVPELRKMLVPRAYADLPGLRDTIRELNHLQPTQPLWLEVVLFDALNDSATDAQALLDFCRGLRVEVNLIPYNRAAAQNRFRAASRRNRERFANILRAAGIRTTIRTSFGAPQNAACGQLAPSVASSRPTVPPAAGVDPRKAW